MTVMNVDLLETVKALNEERVRAKRKEAARLRKNAQQNAKRANFTPEKKAAVNAKQSAKQNAKRANRTPEQRAADNATQRERVANWTPERKEAERLRQKASDRERVANRTPEQREADNAKERERKANRTPEQREADNAAKRIANMTPEQRDTQNASHRERNANMTPEQRAARNACTQAKRDKRTPEQREADNSKQNANRATRTPEQRAADIATQRDWNAKNPEQAAMRTMFSRMKKAAIRLALNEGEAVAVVYTKDTGTSMKELEAMCGYTVAMLKQHVENQFVDGMTWENYGEWHFDHRKPLSAYIKEGITDPKIVHALSNLTPLSAADNMSKGAKHDPENDVPVEVLPNVYDA